MQYFYPNFLFLIFNWARLNSILYSCRFLVIRRFYALLVFYICLWVLSGLYCAAFWPLAVQLALQLPLFLLQSGFFSIFFQSVSNALLSASIIPVAMSGRIPGYSAVPWKENFLRLLYFHHRCTKSFVAPSSWWLPFQHTFLFKAAVVTISLFLSFSIFRISSVITISRAAFRALQVYGAIPLCIWVLWPYFRTSHLSTVVR